MVQIKEPRTIIKPFPLKCSLRVFLFASHKSSLGILLSWVNIANLSRNNASTSHLSLSHSLNLAFESAVARLRLPRPWLTLAKEQFNLFQTLASGFRVSEEGLSRRAEAENSIDDEELPRYVLEAGGNEESNGEVEEPVRNSGQGHSRGSRFQAPHFGGIHPCNRSQCQSIDNDHEVRESDDSVRRRSSDADWYVEIAVDTTRNIHTILAEYPADNKEADSHADGTIY